MTKYFNKVMETMTPRGLIVIAPFVGYVVYKLSLEMWCIAYGLVY